jgi:hypothetical protein
MEKQENSSQCGTGRAMAVQLWLRLAVVVLLAAGVLPGVAASGPARDGATALYLPLSYTQVESVAPRSKPAVRSNLLPEASDRYQLQALSLPPGAVPFKVHINNAGTVVAQLWFPADSLTVTATLEKGTWKPLSPQFDTSGQITASGRIAGGWIAPKQLERGAYCKDGKYTVYPGLPGLPGCNWVMTALSESGDMVVAYDSSSGFSVAFANKSFSTFRPIQPPGALETWAFALNNRNWVVGRAFRSEGFYSGFLFDGRNYSFVGLPGFHVWLTALNERGDLAGYYFAGSVQAGLIIEAGGEYSFSIPGAEWTAVDCLNDRGQLSGTYGILGSQGLMRKAFIATRLKR